MMKKELITIGIGLLLNTVAIHAENIQAKNFRFRRVKEQVVLQFDVQTPDKTVRSNYRLFLTPQLTDGNQSKELRPFIVYGKQNMQREQQKRLLQKRAWDSYMTLTNNDRMVYVDTLQFQPWMNNPLCTLNLLVQEEGCCEVKDLAPLCLGKVKLEDFFRPQILAAKPLVSEVKKAQTKYVFLRQWGDDSISARGVSVRFPVDRHELLTDFSSNKENLRMIIDAITLVRSTPGTAVKQISITGYASPEGNTAHNQRLSQQRALALKDYIKQTLNVPDEQFNLTAGGEDWQGLRQLIVESDMRYKDEILDIIDHTPIEKRKSRLRQLAGGRPYQSMFDVLYPQLRDACYINVWYTEKPDETVGIINEAIGDITAERYEQALQRLEKVKEDSRAWNVMGATLMLQGKTEEARQWLLKAADAGDDNAKANLEQMNNNF